MALSLNLPLRSLPPKANRVVISVNPFSRAKTSLPRVERLVQLLDAKGFITEVLSDLSAVASRANQWHAAGSLRALVGVGGDGTAAELVNRTVPGLPLALFPAGNENLLARYLGLGHTPEACCETITAARVAQFDAARAGNRIFLLMLGCGFDAEVVHRLHSRRTAHVGRWHYLKPFISAVRSYEYPEMQVQWGEGVVCAGETPARPLSARWLFAFNLPCYGGGLRICGQADGTDGLLDVCTFRGGGLWRTIEYIGAALMRQHQRLADFAVHRTQRLRITAEAEVRYQLDGDPGGVLPVEVETLPGRLSALVP